MQSSGEYIVTPRTEPGTRPEKEPFAATRADAAFAGAYLVLGVLFYRWMMDVFPWQGGGVLLFTLLFAGVNLGYAFAKRVPVQKSSWYWLGILLLLGTSYLLWPTGSLYPYKGLVFMLVAVYWCGSVFGIQLEGKTGNMLLLDGLNLALWVPLRNGLLAWHSLRGLVRKRGERTERGRAAARRTRGVLLGVLLCVPVFIFVVPMLVQADAGGFSQFLRDITYHLFRFIEHIFSFNIWQLVFGVVVGCYLFGLAAGGAHKRYTRRVDVKRVRRDLALARKLQVATVAALLVCIGVLYAVFIGFQIPYYFSAFGGVLPQGYTNHAEYARQGFFELCRIAGLNLCILLGANLVCRVPRADNRLLRGLNIFLSGVTLLLLATAFSKMAMYIGTFGLTPKRILTSVFMLFLAGLWGGVIALQFRAFSIVRFGAVLGSAMFCLLALSNMDYWVVAVNADLYQAGRIPRYETVLLTNLGLGGAERVWELARTTQDEALAQDLERYLNRETRDARVYNGSLRDTVAYHRVRMADIDRYLLVE